MEAAISEKPTMLHQLHEWQKEHISERMFMIILALIVGFFAAVAALGKEPRLRALHGKIHVPASMVHPPYASHAAMNRIRSHLVCIQDRVAVVYLLVGDRFRSFSFC